MTKRFIRSHLREEFQIDQAGQHWIFTKGSSVSPEGSGIFSITNTPDTTVTINGTVTVQGAQLAVLVEGDQSEVIVGRSGLVSGGSGIAIVGNQASIRNNGRIVCDVTAMTAIGGVGAELRNDGLISGENGMASFNDETSIVNSKGAVLLVENFGIQIGSDAGVQNSIVNHGSILSNSFAVITSDGDETVINDGIMQGTVSLGAGNDRFDNRNGELDGSVIGGGGDDTLIVDDGDVALVEEAGGGNDVVRSTVSYTLSDNIEELFLLGKADATATGNGRNNNVHGNSGDNTINGFLGADHLFGHKGKDELAGGLGADVFHFATGDGRDILTDYADGIDHIDLSNWNAIEDFEDLADNHLRVKGEDLVIRAGSDELVIRNMALANLDETDFSF
jgi:Ca2+-binding RTX toxin-like protein